MRSPKASRSNSSQRTSPAMPASAAGSITFIVASSADLRNAFARRLLESDEWGDLDGFELDGNDGRSLDGRGAIECAIERRGRSAIRGGERWEHGGEPRPDVRGPKRVVACV